MEIRKKDHSIQQKESASLQASKEALRSTLREMRSNSVLQRNLRQNQRINSARSQQRRLNQIRQQENQRIINQRYQNSAERARINQTAKRVNTKNLVQQDLNTLDEKAREFASFIANQKSLEGLDLESAVKLRLQQLEEAKEYSPSVDPIVSFSESGFANELRFAQFLDTLTYNPTLALVSHEFKEFLTEQGQNNLSWLLDFLRQLRKRKRSFKYITEEDLAELMVIQFYPILLMAITKVLSRGISEEVLSTEMHSLNGELVDLMRQAAREDHPAHSTLQTVKEMSQYIGNVAWDDGDVI